MGDFRGYYEDGAYVAYADSRVLEEERKGHGDDGEDGQDTSERGSESDGSESGEDRPHNSSADEIRDAYFASITTRYTALRKRLQTDPPHGALDALPTTNPSEVGAWKRGLATFQIWESRLRGTDPLPAQIAAMHKDSVFRLLRILLTTKFLRTGTQVRERTSRWLWALLARLPDKGELDYMEVGWVRELGKRAVLLMVSLAELEVLKEHYDVAGSSPGDQDEFEVDVDVDDCFSDTTPSGDIPLDPVDAPTPEIAEEDDEPAIDSKESTTKPHTRQAPHGPANATLGSNNASVRTPNHDEASDVEMQLDTDIEEGEVADEPPSPRSDHITDIETAKARLLAQLDGNIVDDGGAEDCHSLPASAPVTQLEPTTPPITSDVQAVPTPTEAEASQEEGEYEPDEDDEDDVLEERHYRELDRAKVNERATLNMILTVAGEFYGQRDLLEFRDPFGGL